MYAGDTLLFALTFSDYPASDGWSAAFDFRAKDGGALTFSATASGDDHLVSLAPATTAVWPPELYSGTGKVSKTGQTFTVWKGKLEVKIDLSQQSSGYDTRTHARICLDAIEAVMEGKATRDVLNTTIAGQSIGRLTPDQLIAFRAYYRAEVLGEEAQEALENGGPSGKNILAIFNTP
jgi:hypothetical protein